MSIVDEQITELREELKIKEEREELFEKSAIDELNKIKGHAEGYNYMGGGTALNLRLKNLYKIIVKKKVGKEPYIAPINRLDLISLQHDIGYTSEKNILRYFADNRMLYELDKLINDKEFYDELTFAQKARIKSTEAAIKLVRQSHYTALASTKSGLFTDEETKTLLYNVIVLMKLDPSFHFEFYEFIREDLKDRELKIFEDRSGFELYIYNLATDKPQRGRTLEERKQARIYHEYYLKLEEHGKKWENWLNDNGFDYSRYEINKKTDNDFDVQLKNEYYELINQYDSLVINNFNDPEKQLYYISLENKVLFDNILEIDNTLDKIPQYNIEKPFENQKYEIEFKTRKELDESIKEIEDTFNKKKEILTKDIVMAEEMNRGTFLRKYTNSKNENVAESKAEIEADKIIKKTKSSQIVIKIVDELNFDDLKMLYYKKPNSQIMSVFEATGIKLFDDKDFLQPKLSKKKAQTEKTARKEIEEIYRQKEKLDKVFLGEGEYANSEYHKKIANNKYKLGGEKIRATEEQEEKLEDISITKEQYKELSDEDKEAIKEKFEIPEEFEISEGDVSGLSDEDMKELLEDLKEVESETAREEEDIKNIQQVLSNVKNIKNPSVRENIKTNMKEKINAYNKKANASRDSKVIQKYVEIFRMLKGNYLDAFPEEIKTKKVEEITATGDKGVTSLIEGESTVITPPVITKKDESLYDKPKPEKEPKTASSKVAQEQDKPFTSYTKPLTEEEKREKREFFESRKIQKGEPSTKQTAEQLLSEETKTKLKVVSVYFDELLLQKILSFTNPFTGSSQTKESIKAIIVNDVLDAIDEINIAAEKLKLNKAVNIPSEELLNQAIDELQEKIKPEDYSNKVEITPFNALVTSKDDEEFNENIELIVSNKRIEVEIEPYNSIYDLTQNEAVSNPVVARNYAKLEKNIEAEKIKEALTKEAHPKPPPLPARPTGRQPPPIPPREPPTIPPRPTGRQPPPIPPRFRPALPAPPLPVAPRPRQQYADRPPGAAEVALLLDPDIGGAGGAFIPVPIQPPAIVPNVTVSQTQNTTDTQKAYYILPSTKVFESTPENNEAQDDLFSLFDYVEPGSEGAEGTPQTNDLKKMNMEYMKHIFSKSGININPPTWENSEPDGQNIPKDLKKYLFGAPAKNNKLPELKFGLQEDYPNLLLVNDEDTSIGVLNPYSEMSVVNDYLMNLRQGEIYSR